MGERDLDVLPLEVDDWIQDLAAEILLEELAQAAGAVRRRRRRPKVAEVLRLYKIPAVVVNISDPKDDVLATYAKRNTGTPVVFDATDATKENWTIESVPWVVYFNANGQVGYRGPAVWKDLGAAVEKSAGLAPGTVNFTVQGTGGG